MFRKIIIQLDGPICSCDEEKLQWTVGRALREENGVMLEGAYLQVTCKTCKTKLHVPNEKFVASFELKKGYPRKRPEEPKEDPKPKLGVIQGGKVIPFVNEEGKADAGSKDP